MVEQKPTGEHEGTEDAYEGCDLFSEDEEFITLHRLKQEDTE